MKYGTAAPRRNGQWRHSAEVLPKVLSHLKRTRQHPKAHKQSRTHGADPKSSKLGVHRIPTGREFQGSFKTLLFLFSQEG